MNVLRDVDPRRLARIEPPQWLDPMNATLTDERFSDPGWLFERKLDGERCLAYRRGGTVRLLTRNRKEVGNHYPEIEAALAGQAAEDYVLDGEVVAFEGNQTSFARLQRRMQLADPEQARATGVAVHYYLFDALYAAGHDLRQLPLRQRKQVLRRLLEFTDPLRFTSHRNRDGHAYYRQACRQGWEGLIAKRADDPYRGGRSTSWLKFKCAHGQELVVCGYTDPKGTRTGFGALLLGYYDRVALRYAGRVGTGFDEQTLTELHRRLAAGETDRTPYRHGSPSGRGVHWVRPELVAQVQFTEWTSDGQLRHPRFVGLREDKPPTDVIREQ